jgi:hypothetical protein
MAKGKDTKNTKKRKQRKIDESMKIILTDTPDDTGEEEEEDVTEMGGILWDKADMQLLYHALMHYKPTEEEKQLCDILREEFEEILVCDYGEKLPEGK